MLSLVRYGVRFPLQALALAMGIGAFAGSSVLADDGGHADFNEGRFKHSNLDNGTLGWAEYGVYPGLYGFSLRWHLGYGYGLYALGVGADGGYPFYGGPGYPHEPPLLRRFGPATPYAYFGGTDYPLFGCTNFYQGIGGLVVDKPVVSIGEPGDFGYVGPNGEIDRGNDFGHFTGALPYPEPYFAPYASAPAATGSSGAERASKPATPSPPK
jgi:hypothetical protein